MCVGVFRERVTSVDEAGRNSGAYPAAKLQLSQLCAMNEAVHKLAGTDRLFYTGKRRLKGEAARGSTKLDCGDRKHC